MESRLEQRQIGSSNTGQNLNNFNEDIELANLRRKSCAGDVSSESKIAVESAVLGWSELSPPVINGIDMHLHENAWLTLVIGPVGSGKSTFLKGLLGETSVFRGLVKLEDSEIAFCDQTPWIANASIKENIVGVSVFETGWYNEVVWACALVCI